MIDVFKNKNWQITKTWLKTGDKHDQKIILKWFLQSLHRGLNFLNGYDIYFHIIHPFFSFTLFPSHPNLSGIIINQYLWDIYYVSRIILVKIIHNRTCSQKTSCWKKSNRSSNKMKQKLRARSHAMVKSVIGFLAQELIIWTGLVWGRIMTEM